MHVFVLRGISEKDDNAGFENALRDRFLYAEDQNPTSQQMTAFPTAVHIIISFHWSYANLQ